MLHGLQEIVFVCGALVLVSLAERSELENLTVLEVKDSSHSSKQARGGNSTVLEVRHSSGMVAIDPQGIRRRKDSSVPHSEPQRAIGEFRMEASAELPTLADKAHAAEPSASPVSLDDSVQQALRALIKSSGHHEQLPTRMQEALSSREQGETKLKVVSAESLPVLREQGEARRVTLLTGEARLKALASEASPASTDQGSGKPRPAVTQVPTGDDASTKGQRTAASDEAGGLQEVVLSTSSAAPSEVYVEVEELERHSTSVLSVVFFSYLLMSLAAFALCTAYVARSRGEASSETINEDKWKFILRYGSFGETGS